MKTTLKTAATAVAVIIALLAAETAEARGHAGSHRYGGVNSHGKWSHYR